MKLRSLFCPPPFKARHTKRTLICSPDDDPGRPSAELIELALRVIRRAVTIDLETVTERMPEGPYWPRYWPGEHYRLLAGFIQELQPESVVEVGTFTGLSSLSMLPFLPDHGRLVTFDLCPWNDFAETCLRPGDFESDRLRQIIGDLSDPSVAREHTDLLTSSAFLFIDGPKDKVFEPRFYAALRALPRSRPQLLVFDDIKDWNMLAFWRSIREDKLDLTSFGHWTGTGLVSLAPGDTGLP